MMTVDLFSFILKFTKIVPFTKECSHPMTGIPGVCCRDPNYKDPWPDMNGMGMMMGMMNKGGNPMQQQTQAQSSPNRFNQPNQQYGSPAYNAPG